MIESLLFLFICALIALGFLLLLRRFPTAAARLAVWGSVALLVLMERLLYSVFSFPPDAYSYAQMVYDVELCQLLPAGVPQGSLGGALLFIAFSLSVAGLMLLSRIPALARRCSRQGRYLAFSMAFTLLFLQFGLFMHSAFPWMQFILPWGMSLATAALLLALLLALWQLGVYALARHLEASQRRPGRRRAQAR